MRTLVSSGTRSFKACATLQSNAMVPLMNRPASANGEHDTNRDISQLGNRFGRCSPGGGMNFRLVSPHPGGKQKVARSFRL